MTRFPIAVQLYSIRDDMASDFEGSLKAVKDMGYDGVEFAGLYGRSPEQVKALCDELGLVPISAHVAYAEMMEHPEQTMADYAAIGCRYIAIPYLTEEYRPGAEKYDTLVKDIHMLGKVAKDHGLTLLYHNHDFEFQKIDGEYALDRLYNAVPADLLQTQMDTCWVNVGGEDPAAYLRKYAGRAPVVHLKDFVMPGKKPQNMYHLIGIDDDQPSDVSGFEYRPLGMGAQNVPEILKACEDVGAEWIVVEQDDPCLDKTPLDCIRLSVDYLKGGC